MAKHKLDVNRPYTPPETPAEYKKRLGREARTVGGVLTLWADKLEIGDDLSVTTVRAGLRLLQESINRL
jgi:hypothetical protein